MKSVCIIKFYEEFSLKLKGMDDRYPVWGQVHIVESREHCGVVRLLRVRRITHREAATLIRENGLVVAKKNEDGIIYDTPEKDFQKEAAFVRVPRDLGY